MSYLIKNTGKLAGKTVFITGGSRGIGREIALKLASDGANVTIASKTSDPHPKLKGTIHSVAEEVEKAGGKSLAIQMDLRFEDQVSNAVEQTVKKFGGIDILVNNASAISLTNTLDTTMKKYDLMHQINSRGTFLASKLCIPHLKKSSNPHILNLSPPLIMKPHWFENTLAYTMAKYGMSLCVLGMASELKSFGIAVNGLWPRTMIWTAALEMISQSSPKNCRDAAIIADAAYAILNKNSKEATGNFYIDEAVLKDEGITNFDSYAIDKNGELISDLFLPDEYYEGGISEFKKLAKDSLNQKEVKDTKSNITNTGLKSEKIFSLIESTINNNDTIKKEINSLLEFTISGQNFYVDLDESRPFKISTETDEKPGVTLITDDDTFFNMARGKQNSTTAFMSGKLKIKGNMALALKIEKLFKKFKVDF